MTPEEKAVINLVLRWREESLAGNGEFSFRAFKGVADALVFSCPQCNAGGHTCPGDGNPISHTQTDCGQHVDGSVRTAETLPCWECLTDPTEDPSPWCDCRKLGERCAGPCRQRAHAPDRCPNMSPAWRDRHPAPVWVETDMRQCLAGDRIRMGASEANVLRSVSGVWHADNGDAWHPRGWEHLEFRAELDVVPGFRQYPPNASIEILCTPERRAILLLQDAFPGSAVTSSDVD